MQHPSFDTWTSLFLFAVMQGLFLSFMLYSHKKGNQAATRILATLILLFSIMLAYYVAYWTGYAMKYKWMNGWVEGFTFLYGPLLFFYINVLEKNKMPARYRLHLIPFIVYFLTFIPLLASNIGLSSPSWKSFLNRSFWNMAMMASYILQIAGVTAYSILFYTHLRKDFLLLNKFASKEELIKHQWLKKITFFYAGFSLSFVSYFILAWTGVLKPEYDYMVSFGMSAFIYMVGYIGFRQPEIFNLQIPRKEQRYEKSSLKQDMMKAHLEKLLAVMENEKPFLNSELKIQNLAMMISVSSHHLSQIINDGLKQNYADFINSYRINEAKRLLLDPEYEEKILSVAFDVGYNNKVTFNAAFKKLTGMAPTQFKRAEQEKVLAQ